MIVKRVALGFLTLILLSLLIFLSVEALPGDLAQEILGQQATPEAVAAIRKDLGLDLPPHTLCELARGDAPGRFWYIFGAQTSYY